MENNKEVIAQLLKQREEIEEQIISLDPKALVLYEMERLTDNKSEELFYTQDELLNAVTVFNISTNCTTVKQAQEEFPELFKNKREFAKDWIVKFFNL